MTKPEDDEQFYRDTESVAFPKLDDQQLAMLDPIGSRRIVRRGEVVFKAGQRDLGLTAVVSGELEAFELRDGEEQILATAGRMELPSLGEGFDALHHVRIDPTCGFVVEEWRDEA